MATIGIDIGGTKARGVRVEDGAAVERTSSLVGDGDLIATATAAARELWTEEVDAVGVGLAGLVRWPEGTFAWGPHPLGTSVPVPPSDSITSSWSRLAPVSAEES